MSAIPWEAAINAKDPAALARILATRGRHEIMGDRRWPSALALRVAREQWAGDRWLPPHHEDWMALWQDQRQHLDLGPHSQPGLAFSLLAQMTQMQDRYAPGEMRLDLWLAHVDDLVAHGMTLGHADATGITPLEQLLTRTTVVPYPAVARHWMVAHRLPFPPLAHDRLAGLLDKMAKSWQGSPGMLSEDALWVMEQAVGSADPAGLTRQVEHWVGLQDIDLGSLSRIATARELEKTLPSPEQSTALRRL